MFDTTYLGVTEMYYIISDPCIPPNTRRINLTDKVIAWHDGEDRFNVVYPSQDIDKQLIYGEDGLPVPTPGMEFFVRSCKELLSEANTTNEAAEHRRDVHEID
jgi:hypothetical protein